MDKVNEMADAVAKEGELDEATLPETQPAAEPEPEKVEPEAKEETEVEPKVKPPASYLAEKPGEEQEERQNFVPVSALQKERQRRQELQRENAELRAAKIEPETDLDLSDLEQNPEEFMTNQRAAVLIKQAAQAGAKSAVSQIEKRIQAEQQQSAANQQRVAIAQSEEKAREKFADFDVVVKTAIENGSFTPDEISSIRRSANPGVVLYRKSKEALSMLGISVQQTKEQELPGNPQNPEGEEDIYASVFGKKSG